MSNQPPHTAPSLPPALRAAIATLLAEIDAEVPPAVGVEGWTEEQQQAFAAGWRAKELRVRLASADVRRALEG